ncbi:MAG: efflux RND transporter permease subunit [Candidatus Auribacter fodinae]|jgi:Cu(I)/Ag(I) efflux system membrane protein CusA/SilA|uniref:Efflux RND transporter permease subunit n=1 Tax=Candidatus Auribacter fodinae TaxID=2093366 RepID=A0A3A4QZR5_9BACT|nr:MAG: efflux RND transporter permease subunit [Candidatus Auribacter fodinae]
MNKIIRFFLENKIIVFLLTLFCIGWGIMAAPFDWDIAFLPRDPVPVDAIPDIGENQQIVFTQWPGRSPRDVEDQVTYPLTVLLLGIPQVKTIRSFSMMGFSSIYIIFKENADFYWARSRIVEKLNSLPPDALPEGVSPVIGPDATSLGQIFWYTLEGLDNEGNPTGGWDLNELRTVQDWYVKYALLSVEGVSETASIGGFVQEYQIDVDPNAMRAHSITISDIFKAVRKSNLDVGARTIEVNKVEYVIRGTGFIRSIDDIRNTVVKVNDNVPLLIKNVANVSLGPALRRGVLDKEGSEVVGGVVVARYGENPLEVINSVKRKIAEIEPGLPRRTLPDGTESKVSIVPFYDRTELIHETLNTLHDALFQEIMITIIVILIMIGHMQSAALISGLLPLAVLICFIVMKNTGVDANIVALSGIAIAIGTMVDIGIILCENIVKHLEAASPEKSRLEVVYDATKEVASAVFTSVATTVIGFLPVFTMHGPEGKLFKPLAYTKSFALASSLGVALVIIPPAAHILFGGNIRSDKVRTFLYSLLLGCGFILWVWWIWWVGCIISSLALYSLITHSVSDKWKKRIMNLANTAAVVCVLWRLSSAWMPLGPEKGNLINMLFIGVIVGSVLFMFYLFKQFYSNMLRWCLSHKMIFLSIPLFFLFIGMLIWLGFPKVFGWLPNAIKTVPVISRVAHAFPGLGKEFMPPLDEGSFLFMPTTMPHASIGEAADVLHKQDVNITALPEIRSAVGKLGRVESPLDPAPISMIETVITYYSEYVVDEKGRLQTFKYDPEKIDFFRTADGTIVNAPDGKPYRVRGSFERDKHNQLIPDPSGHPFRMWRPALDPSINDGREHWKGITSPDDIWDQIISTAEIPGTTSAPRLQPIAARLVMLQSGMRAPMGIKIKGPDLLSLEETGISIESFLKEVPSIEAPTVYADRIVGKPYLEIDIDRAAIARFGINVQDVQDVIEVAIGGKPITATVEGRERYVVRIRYLRELRDSIESLGSILIPGHGGVQVPLAQLADIQYVRGPQAIKSEDTFLVTYVIFDKKSGFAEVDVVEQARDYLQRKIRSGELVIPPGVSFVFAGSYENQVRSEKTLRIVLPLALFIIFMILYLHFRSTSLSLLVFSGILVAWAGGFMLIWLYGQQWFMDFSMFGVNMRELFHMHPINLSVAVWVGFLALFGIASDDGVVMATYLQQSFDENPCDSIPAIREAVVQAGEKRVRPCLMTTATTILALIPVLTSTGKGSDIMVPMAIPSFGGMVIEVITMLVVPVLYSSIREYACKLNRIS